MTETTSNDFCLRLDDLGELFKQKPEKTKKELALLGIDTFLVHGKAFVTPENVRRFLQAKGYRYQPQVLSFQMLKGGVAKTTSCLNVGLRAAMYGFRVLFMDLDQQANLSFALGVDDLEAPVFVDVLERKRTLSKAIRSLAPNIGLLPSNLNNSVIERVLLQGVRNLGRVVRGPIEEVMADYDLVLIDTAPSLSALNTAVTCASDRVVLPINPDKFTLFGVQKHLADLEVIREDFNLDFDVRILFTKYDARESSSQAYFSQCLDLFGPRMVRTYVRQTTDIKNTIATGRTIFDSKGNAKEDYDRVTRELFGLW
jgi:chromosome partitioning protein